MSCYTNACADRWTARMNPNTHQSSQRVVDHQAANGERSFATLTHLSPLLGYALLGGIPGISIIAPLVMWQVRKKDSPFLDDHGREALNFQLSLLIYTIVTLGLFGLAAPILSIIFNIIAGISASKGEFYRYPICLRLIGSKE